MIFLSKAHDSFTGAWCGEIKEKKKNDENKKQHT